ncbi:MULTISPECIES: tryptophan halogenase family protein [Microbulbifer]|uniref:tryptophan halogenase family protein n=1 Tax=Microbulbifer TaxID=48073 RepID=UPI00074B2873|nr:MULTISPECIES: tryptophan halogenase family protein [Microbulbifer]KUJ82480.1 hypothetical protein AVO43_11765 [Microbulbifer sp. ZGT114]
MDTIRNIVIVGGGTAGWLVAASLAKQLNILADPETTITLVESPDTPTIGVGEGTWPTMRNTLKRIGIDETDFIRECDVSFKQGTQFVNWHKLNRDGSDAAYYHSFELPHTQWRTAPGPYWHYLQSEIGLPYADAISVQPEACRGNFAPKTMATPTYEGLLNYAYHLDAGKFARMLQRVATSDLGVQHVSAHIERANLSKDGYIASLSTREAGDIDGDFFVDCSGFTALLIDGTYDIPFRSVSDKLFVNSAIAIQMPYQSAAEPIASPTISTAQQAGWIWDIGLHSRRGTGHVYSDDFISDDEAEDQLRRYLGPGSEQLDAKRIKMRLGYREKVFHKNCVAVGLSAAFLEPLEASAIFLIEASCNMLGELFPRNRAMLELLEKRYNASFISRWNSVVDFIKLHYFLSGRTDSEFWIENTRPETAPDSLKEYLEFWRYYPPSRFDLSSSLEPFVRESYEFILFGMGYGHYQQSNPARLPHLEYARENFARIAQMRSEVPSQLVTNRRLLDQLKDFRFQSI